MNFADMHNIGASIKAKSMIPPQDAAAGTIGGTTDGFDRQDFQSMVLHGHVGGASGTPTAQSVIFKLQHSSVQANDDADWADLTGAAGAALTADNAEVQVDIDLSNAKQYIRPVAVVSFTGGSTPKIEVASVMVMGGARERPVA